ncbi:MAG: hypothetical protein ACN6O3_10060 [Comamonas sp.]
MLAERYISGDVSVLKIYLSNFINDNCNISVSNEGGQHTRNIDLHVDPSSFVTLLHGLSTTIYPTLDQLLVLNRLSPLGAQMYAQAFGAARKIHANFSAIVNVNQLEVLPAIAFFKSYYQSIHQAVINIHEAEVAFQSAREFLER